MEKGMIKQSKAMSHLNSHVDHSGWWVGMVCDGANLDIFHRLGGKDLQGVARCGAHVGKRLVGLLLDMTIINLRNNITETKKK